MVNSHDPHRPFYDPEGKKKNGEEVPSRLFKPEEVVVPPYLPDLPKVRIEYSHYLNSVRRLDDTVGRVLQALEDSGLAGNTMVVFITDNGSSFPFAKANTYVASNRTPMLVRWRGSSVSASWRPPPARTVDTAASEPSSRPSVVPAPPPRMRKTREGGSSKRAPAGKTPSFSTVMVLVRTWWPACTPRATPSTG